MKPFHIQPLESHFRHRTQEGSEHRPLEVLGGGLTRRRSGSGRSPSAGFTLAEIAVALGIFAFALVSMLSLMSVGLKNSRRASAQTVATNVLSGITADILASSKTVNPDSVTVTYKSPKLQISTSVSLPSSGEQKVTDIRSAASPLLIGESGSVISPSGPNMLEKTFSVVLLPPSNGTLAVRVRLEWPGRRPSGTNPEGFIETLAPLPF